MRTRRLPISSAAKPPSSWEGVSVDSLHSFEDLVRSHRVANFPFTEVRWRLQRISRNHNADKNWTDAAMLNGRMYSPSSNI